MSEILKVKSFFEAGNYHDCIDEKGKRRRVDLMVSGCLEIGPKEIVGRSIKVGWTHCYLEIAEDIEITEDE